MLHVDDLVEIADVLADVVVGLGGGGFEGLGEGDTADAGELCGEEFVGAVLDGFGDVGVGGAAVGRVVLEAAILWRVVRGGDDDAVGEAGTVEVFARVVGEDGVREGGCGGVAVGGGRSLLGAAACVDAGFHVVGGQDFKRGAEGGFREAVGVHGEEERAGVALAGAVLDDGLGDGEDVVLVEGGVEGGAAVAAGAEADFLVGVAGVGVQGVVGGQEAREVDEGVEAG